MPEADEITEGFYAATRPSGSQEQDDIGNALQVMT
jgi:hypothetical protein